MTEYVTKDSGQREEYDSGMRRDTREGKPDFSLIMPLDVPYDQQMLTRWAALMARGAEKYGERNWELASSDAEYRRFRASAFRHFCQWFTGDSPEEDHAAAVFFNITAAERIGSRKLPKLPEGYQGGYGPTNRHAHCVVCGHEIYPRDSATYTAVVGDQPMFYHGGCWETRG